MIWRAYSYFQSKLLEEIKKKNLSPKENYDYILTLARKLSSWQTIIITTENEAQAYTLFDSLNNRGVPLSPIDIVKNTLFSKMAEYHINIDAKNKEWEDLLERIDSEKLLRRFFVDYYNIYLRKEETSEILTENKIIDVYGELIKGYKTQSAIVKFYDDMLKMSEIYALITHPYALGSNDFGGGDCGARKAPLIYLNEMSAIPAYGFLMYLYDKFELRTTKWAEKREKFDIFTDVVTMLSKFFAIRHVTDTPRVKHLPLLFDRWLLSIKANVRSATYEDFKESFIAVILNDEKKRFNIEGKSIVQDKMRNLEYESQNTRTALIRYLFTIYEMQNADQTRVSSLKPYIELWKHNPNSNKGEFLYSIEHIIPEGEEIKGESAKQWAEELGEDYSAKKRSYFIHKLGNLGLLEPNKEAAQRSFAKKKEYYKAKGFRMFEEDVLTAEKWTKTEVENRTKNLALCITDYLYADFTELDTKPDSE